MGNNIQFTDYDRITDILIYLSNNITLNFTVALSRKDKTGGRSFFQYETEYDTRYIGSNKGRGIKRNMNFYFTLDNKNDFGNGLILRLQDVYLICKLIENQVLPWYFGTKRIFAISKDKSKLIIKGEYNPINYIQSEYKYISFSPFVFEYEDGTFKEGIRIYLNSQTEYADMSIDKFLEFYYLLSKTDMYAVATNMVTYAKQSPYGINIFKPVGLGGGYNPRDNWNSDNNYSEDKKDKGVNNFLNNAGSK